VNEWIGRAQRQVQPALPQLDVGLSASLGIVVRPVAVVIFRKVQLRCASSSFVTLENNGDL
jgi:hypothetical protein